MNAEKITKEYQREGKMKSQRVSMDLRELIDN